MAHAPLTLLFPSPPHQSTKSRLRSVESLLVLQWPFWPLVPRFSTGDLPSHFSHLFWQRRQLPTSVAEATSQIGAWPHSAGRVLVRSLAGRTTSVAHASPVQKGAVSGVSVSGTRGFFPSRRGFRQRPVISAQVIVSTPGSIRTTIAGLLTIRLRALAMRAERLPLASEGRN